MLLDLAIRALKPLPSGLTARSATRLKSHRQCLRFASSKPVYKNPVASKPTYKPYRPVRPIKPSGIPTGDAIPPTLPVYDNGRLPFFWLGFTKIIPLICLTSAIVYYAPAVWQQPEAGPLHSVLLVVITAIPVAFVSGYTKCFVKSVHLVLPPVARQSRTSLDKFLQDIPMNAKVTVTTMQAILPVPKQRQLRLSELKTCRAGWISPANLIVNHAEIAKNNAFNIGQKSSFWSRPTNEFYIGSNALAKPYKIVWNSIWQKIAK